MPSSTDPGPASGHYLDDLSIALPHAVALPGSALYEKGRTVFSPVARRRAPAAVIRPRDQAEVAEVLARANRTRTRVSVRSGGHAFDGFPVRDGGLLLDLGALDSVELDGDNRLVAMPGATNALAARVLHPAGRGLPLGDCPTVALGGLVSGGGFGYATRSFGMMIDNLAEATVVTGDGRIVTASPAENADLYWACRGGTGAAGVMTRMVFDTFPVGPVTSLTLDFAWEAAAEIVTLYEHVVRTSPPALDMKFKIRTTGTDRFADMASAGPPDAIPGTPLVHVDGQFMGPRHEAETWLKPFLEHPAAGTPVLREGSYFDATLQLVPLDFLNDPAPPTLRPLRVASDFPRGALLPDHAAAIVRFVEALQTGDGLYGGAALIEPAGRTENPPGRADTAYPHRAADFILQWELFASADGNDEIVPRHSALLHDVRHALSDVLTGGRYVNYADRLDTPADWWGGNLERLSAIAETYDPAGTLISRLRP